jgi:hypothetical protein
VVRSCLISFLTLHHTVLHHIIPHYPVESRPLLSCFVPHYQIVLSLVLSFTALPCRVESSPVQSSPVQSSPVLSVPHYPVESSPVQSFPVLYCSTLSSSVLSCTALPCRIEFLPVLSCTALLCRVQSSRLSSCLVATGLRSSWLMMQHSRVFPRYESAKKHCTQAGGSRGRDIDRERNRCCIHRR